MTKLGSERKAVQFLFKKKTGWQKTDTFISVLIQVEPLGHLTEC